MRFSLPTAVLAVVLAASVVLPAAASPRSTLVEVATSAELAAALAAAAPGHDIVLADGEYTFATMTGRHGTASQPITIRAAHPGRAVVTLGTPKIVDSSYVTVQGIAWHQPAEKGAIALQSTTRIRVTGNRFRLAPVAAPVAGKSYHWVVVAGPDSSHNRIDHNLFEGKRQLGVYVAIQDNGPQVSQHDRVDHNYFRDASQIVNPDGTIANGGESIRVGVSVQSESSGHAVIERNLFEDVDSDAEIVSIKSSDNIVRYNTIRSSYGSVSARRGDRNAYYGNWFYGEGKAGAGGIRLYGKHQQVYNNHFEGLTGTGFQAALQIGGGDIPADSDPADSATWSKHWQVQDATIVHNTFAGNVTNIELAGDYTRYDLPPLDSVIADNIVTGGQGVLFNEVLTPVNTRYAGNLAYPTGSATVGVAGIRVADPRLTDGHLAAGSPAIDTATGGFPFVSTDVDGQRRATPDVGADERSDGPVTRRPLTAADFAFLTD
jgi:hypothetical protein